MKTNAKDFLGKEVKVIMDRPLGSKHPKHGFEYEANYGYVPNTISPDGEELDAYYLEEVSEEFGINDIEEIKSLDYKIKFEGKHGPTEAHFISLRVKSLDVPITLNEKGIGYDWMLIDKVKEIMKHDDEKKAFDLIS